MTSMHVNYGEALMKKQFGYIQGLTSTLLPSSRRHPPLEFSALQIIHTQGNHWIAASSTGCKNDVLVFDSLYCNTDGPINCMIMESFGAGVDIRNGHQNGTGNLQSKNELKIVAYLL